MSGVTVPSWRSRVYLANGKVGNKSMASVQACFRHVRYTAPIADVSPRRSEPPLRTFRTPDRSKVGNLHLLLDEFNRADVKETSASRGYQPPIFLITRRRDNDLLTIGPFNDGALMLSPRMRIAADTVSFRRNANAGKTQFNFPCAPIDTHDSVICQVSGRLGFNSELGWEIPVDLKADAHFDEGRCSP
jgi:hypothetical protein